MTIVDEVLSGMEDLDLTPEEIDPEAPHGRRPDGTPYKKSPEHRAKLAATLAQSNLRRQQAAGTKPAAAKARKSTAAGGVDYRPALNGLGQLAAFFVGQFGRLDPTFSLDAVAIQMHVPAVAEAFNETAQHDERLAAILDKVATLGPYGLILNALTPMVMQIAANHRLVPANPQMGILTPNELLAAAGVPMTFEDADPGMPDAGH